jgi:ComF family protein
MVINLALKQLPLFLLKTLRSTLDLIWPPRCGACRQGLEPGQTYPLCPDCQAQMPSPERRACRRCSMPLGPFEEDNHGNFCVDCGQRSLIFTRSACAGEYVGALADLICNYKYSQRARCAHLSRFLALLLYKHLVSESCRIGLHDIDLLLSVPADPARISKRGFDSSAEIARILSRLLGLPYLARVLRKKHSTAPQSGLTRQQRLKNISDSISVSSQHQIKNKTVLLIDDVMTTCATAEECSRSLRQAGAAEVRVAAAGRATEGRHNGKESSLIKQ